MNPLYSNVNLINPASWHVKIIFFIICHSDVRVPHAPWRGPACHWPLPESDDVTIRVDQVAASGAGDVSRTIVALAPIDKR